jgi:hypothetical protein
VAALFATGLAGPAARAAGLTPLEARWLQAARPVLAWARQAAMPLDVVVQPQDAPDAAPLALAFTDGRCQLVFSMRGNPEAQASLDRLPADLRDAGVELMTAHELGHCHRRVDGAWTRVPDGVPLAPVPDALEPDLKSAWSEMKAVRREEGYADLVGLAWTAARHPQQYARLHEWLVAERTHDRLPGSHHDTLAWVRLVPEAGAFAAGGPFEASDAPWKAGLTQPE